MHHSRPDGAPYPKDECLVYAAFKDGEIHHVTDEVFWKKDGTSFPVEYVSTPIMENGGAVGAVVIFRNITERKQVEGELRKHRERLLEMVEEKTAELKTAVQLLTQEIAVRKKTEETLKESESKFRRLSQEFHTLLDAIPDTLILLSPDLKVMWANKGASLEFARDISEITGKCCYELWHSRSNQCDVCHVRKSFLTGQAEITRRSTPDGRLLDSKSFPIKDEDGRTNNVILIVSDVTEKTTLEADAMRASHLASLGELAAGVAHEINNPINGIINYAQLIANKSTEGSKENDIAKRIIKEGDRISGIVRNLLSFARERREEKLAVGLQRIIVDTITLTEAQVRKDGIHIKMDIPGDLPQIIANPQQIQQVFLNIISNARYALNKKYSRAHENKRLEISAKKIPIEGLPHVRITFYDSGCGIPADILDKVINPFFSTKPSGHGTGLGLSISHGLVKDHGGRLMLESEEGRFTRVMVDLPTKEKDGR
jgi:signal transduction histidine kinase